MRSEIVSEWLSASDWAAYHRNAMTGDASARRYERLSHPTLGTVILMDAPPKTCGSQSRFVQIAAHLRALGLAAPEVYAWDETLGLLVLEDLGPDDFAKHLIENTSDEQLLYDHAADVLLALQSAPPPAGLTTMTPIVGAEMINIAFEWAAQDASRDLREGIRAQLHDLLARVDPNPSALSLRDFHAENLIWRPAQTGLSAVGLLDFQDAFITHPTYDLASMLRDARRDVDPGLLDGFLKRLSQSAGDLEETTAAFHVIALQRNLRILGIFHRLARRDNKTNYLKFLPRVCAHLRADLAAPIMKDLAPLVRQAFPELRSE